MMLHMRVSLQRRRITSRSADDGSGGGCEAAAVSVLKGTSPFNTVPDSQIPRKEKLKVIDRPLSAVSNMSLIQ